MANGITAEQVITAIEGSGGFVTQIAKRLGCTPRHVYNLLEKYQTAQDALFNERESMLDMAEGEMYKKIKGGDTTMIIFYLKTQGKKRGYVERQEWAGAGKDGAIKVEHTVNDEQYHRGLSTLADALGAILSQSGTGESGGVDSAE